MAEPYGSRGRGRGHCFRWRRETFLRNFTNKKMTLQNTNIHIIFNFIHLYGPIGTLWGPGEGSLSPKGRGLKSTYFLPSKNQFKMLNVCVIDLGFHFDSNLDQNSNHHLEEYLLKTLSTIHLKIIPVKVETSTLPKSKNIGKQWQGRMKSHFSHT